MINSGQSLVTVITICLISNVMILAGSPQKTESITEDGVKVTKTYQPAKRLDFEIEITASEKDVWIALSTADGLKTWLAPEAKVELKKGGDWIVSFPGASSTGGGTIIDFKQGKSITISAMAPDSFPTVRRERTTAVFEIRSSSDGKTTIVHLSQTGWKTGDEWDKAFNYLAKGNAQLLNMLRERFVNGPIDWAALMKKGDD